MECIRNSTTDRSSEFSNANLETILELLLEFLPLRDAVRTSVLSRNWRFKWATVPKLTFDDDIDFISSKEPAEIIKCIYEILLLHQGPILEFILDIKKFRSCCDIGKIIIFLSRNGIEKITLKMAEGENYCFHKPPSYIFSCQQLTHLSLTNFAFEPPEGICFKSLRTLDLSKVELNPVVCITGFPFLEVLHIECVTCIDRLSIDLPNLEELGFEGEVCEIGFIRTPLLTLLTLTGGCEDYCEFDLINILSSVPLIERLHLSYEFVKISSSFPSIRKLRQPLPFMLNSLQELVFSIDLDAIVEVSAVLCLLFSSPNTQNFELLVTEPTPTNDANAVLELLALQDASSVSLNKLHHVIVHSITGTKTELEFIKFLIAITPELLTIDVHPDSTITKNHISEMQRAVATFPRASPEAGVVFYYKKER